MAKMAICGHDMAENESEYLKPSYFIMTEVKKLFRMGSGREVTNG